MLCIFSNNTVNARKSFICKVHMKIPQVASFSGVTLCCEKNSQMIPCWLMACSLCCHCQQWWRSFKTRFSLSEDSLCPKTMRGIAHFTTPMPFPNNSHVNVCEWKLHNYWQIFCPNKVWQRESLTWKGKFMHDLQNRFHKRNTHLKA